MGGPGLALSRPGSHVSGQVIEKSFLLHQPLSDPRSVSLLTNLCHLDRSGEIMTGDSSVFLPPWRCLANVPATAFPPRNGSLNNDLLRAKERQTTSPHLQPVHLIPVNIQSAEHQPTDGKPFYPRGMSLFLPQASTAASTTNDARDRRWLYVPYDRLTRPDYEPAGKR